MLGTAVVRVYVPGEQWWLFAYWLGPELQSLSGAEFVMPTIGLVGRTGWLALG